MNAFKYLTLAAFLGVTSSAWALDFPWLSFKMKDASEITVAAENLIMNYADGNLLLTSATVNESLPVSNIASMSFSADTSGVTEIETSLSASAKYYTLDGAEAGEFVTVDDARRALPAGIYIAKSASKSFKIIF